MYVTPATPDPAVARDWFDRFEGAGLDGVVAKPVELTYREGERVMLKVKHERTADCVVGGFRWHKDGGGVGSLLLGLYDEHGALHHVGVASGFAVALRKSLVDDLAPYRLERPRGSSLEGDDRRHRQHAQAGSDRAGGTRTRTSRGRPWRLSSCARSATTISRVTGSGTPRRFAAGGTTASPASCTYAQLEVAVPEELARVFGAGS